MKFPLGQLTATPGALDAIREAGQEPSFFLDKHASGDWGTLSENDVRENELSVEQGYRIMSVYRTLRGTKLYVITDADRSTTTIMLPEDY